MKGAARTQPSGTTTIAGATPAADAGLSSADLFASLQEKIRRYILGMVHDPVQADDLTQDVFVTVHRKLDSLRDPDAAVSWLYRIATHVTYDWYRKSSRQPGFDPLEVTGSYEPGTKSASSGATLDAVIEKAEMSACVGGYLADLSDSYRQVILLHDMEGMTNPQIAEFLDVSIDAVKIRLHRARRKLQAALTQNCDFSHDEQNVLVCEPARPGTVAE